MRGGQAPFNLFLNCSTEQLTDLSRRFPYSARLLKMEAKDRPAQVMGLFVARARVVDWRGSTAVRADVELAALMEVTRDYLPVASALEQIVADRLVKEQRHFHKPLRYDADRDLVFPDFVLLDTARPGAYQWRSSGAMMRIIASVGRRRNGIIATLMELMGGGGGLQQVPIARRCLHSPKRLLAPRCSLQSSGKNLTLHTHAIGRLVVESGRSASKESGDTPDQTSFPDGYRALFPRAGPTAARPGSGHPIPPSPPGSGGAYARKR